MTNSHKKGESTVVGSIGRVSVTPEGAAPATALEALQIEPLLKGDSPLNPAFSPIVLEAGDDANVRVVAELVRALG